jgi:hypothetical protein
MGQRTGLAETGDRAHHEARIERVHRLPIEPHARHYAGREVLEKDVGLRDQTAHDLRAGGRLGIDAETLLAAIVLDEKSAVTAFVLSEVAAAVTPWRHLDLDHIRAEIRHQPARRRPGDHLGKVDDRVAIHHVAELFHS